MPLNSEQQSGVDGAWKNMLAPVDRLDDGMLLDVILANQLHQSGVNRARFTSEKDYAEGTIKMSMDFELAHPERNEFIVDVYDVSGKLRRHARYSGAYVTERYQYLMGIPPHAFEVMASGETRPSEPMTQPSIEERQYLQAYQERLEQVAAATQPVR